jgi:hypothetical protein
MKGFATMSAQTIERTSKSGNDIGNVAELIATLAGRLDLGYAKIEEQRAAGYDVSRWEDHWLELLAEYQDLLDRRAA